MAATTTRRSEVLKKKNRKARKRYLDERLAMLARRAKMIEDELLRLDALEDYYRVCIFGSARIKPDTDAYRQVTHLAEALSRHGFDILTGGGPGLMEAANLGSRQGAKTGGENGSIVKAKSFGISIELPFEPHPNRHLDIKRHHHKFSSRLDDFMRLSHSIIVTPGGIGTVLELFFAWQLIQVNHIGMRPIVLLGRDFWKGLHQWLQEVPLHQGLISAHDFEPISIVDTVDEAVEIIVDHYHRVRPHHT